jgi:hypothetical protein
MNALEVGAGPFWVIFAREGARRPMTGVTSTATMFGDCCHRKLQRVGGCCTAENSSHPDGVHALFQVARGDGRHTLFECSVGDVWLLNAKPGHWDK